MHSSKHVYNKIKIIFSCIQLFSFYNVKYIYQLKAKVKVDWMGEITEYLKWKQICYYFKHIVNDILNSLFSYILHGYAMSQK